MKNLAIAIAGNSGSGKTTLSKILSASVLQNSAILECDRYHNWERGDKNWNSFTHLNPAANNLDQMRKDVKNLINNNTIYQVDYNHTNGKFTPKRKIQPKDNMIICGLHSFYCDKDNLYDLKIFMDTDEELQISWKMHRDKKKRGYTYTQVMEQIERRKEDYINFVLPQRTDADLSIKFTRNKNNKMSYSLFIGVDNKFNVEKMCEDLSNLGVGVVRSHLGQKNALFFDNYTPVVGLDKYNNFYDYIVFLVNGILDANY